MLKLVNKRCINRLFTSKVSREKFVILEESVFSDTIKKSKFIAKAYPAKSIEDALKILERVSDFKATHNCWAFNSSDYQRYSDDGEPSGTAGRPILNALSAENIVDAVVVCIRYYGGINLGTGGLTRAYGGTALQALKLANKEVYRPMHTIELEVFSRDFRAIQHLLKPYAVLEQKYEDVDLQETNGAYENTITIKVRIPAEEGKDIQQKLLSCLSGRGKVTLLPS